MPYEPFLNIQLEANGAGFDLRRLPDAPGALVLESGAGETIFISVTASLRHAAERRLGERSPDDARAPRADLRPVTRRVLAATVGSRFEGEAAYLALCRDRRPSDHRAAIERWQGWFLRIDPRAEHPRWSKVCLPGWAAEPEARAGADESRLLVGPFRDKHAAGKHAGTLDDLFDLCRYHSILVQAPHGRACAYKEMGKCPAPCDGSETMDAYRARVGEAAAFARAGASGAAAACECAMLEAARALDFERAARLKARLDAMRSLESGAAARVRSLDAFRWIIVAPAECAGWARIFACAGGALACVADVDSASAAESVAQAWDAAEAHALAPVPDRFSELEQETAGLLCARLLASGRKTARSEVFIRALDMQLAKAETVEAVRRLARRSRKAAPAFDDESLPAAEWSAPADAPPGASP